MEFLALCAYRAGRKLYGDDLVFNSTKVSTRSLSDRVSEFYHENGYDPEDCDLTGSYEYLFDLTGYGIDYADEHLLELPMSGGYVLTYHPDVGIEIINMNE